MIKGSAKDIVVDESKSGDEINQENKNKELEAAFDFDLK